MGCVTQTLTASKPKKQIVYGPSQGGTVDGSEIPNNHPLDVQNLKNNGINYQPQLVFVAGFLNHQRGIILRFLHLQYLFFGSPLRR